jgi:hypothetical protein
MPLSTEEKKQDPMDIKDQLTKKSSYTMSVNFSVNREAFQSILPNIGGVMVRQ